MFCIRRMLQEGKGTDEAIENRNYLAKRMTDEISEVNFLHLDQCNESGGHFTVR